MRQAALLLVLGFAACQSVAGDASRLADLPPLDCAVLVTGGAFLAAGGGEAGTFARGIDPREQAPPETIAIEQFVDGLQQSRVFHRVALDDDAERRRAVRDLLRDGAAGAEAQAFLQRARDDGFDVLLVVEELQDGPIDAQGTNGRWPITFVTWILVGLGMVIPDQTFESRATLRVTLRDLQTGRVLHDPLLVAGPVELALTERTDVLGLLLSIVVPPFWIHDDPDRVGAAVRTTTERRLLLSLARDLKSESVRQRLRERSAARIVLLDDGEPLRVAVDSAESLAVVRLRAERPLPPEQVAAFERDLLASRRWDGERFRHEAALPGELRGSLLQILVGTIRGGVASATFAPGTRP